ncbi:hypothetical protein ILUMI_15130, partial [Ignelater luminosus]
MTNIILTRLEKILLGLASFVLLVSILLALCIAFVLPYHWTKDGYVPKNTNNPEESYYRICGCGQKKITTKTFDCVPRVFSERITIDSTTKPTNTVSGIIQDYPYVVSLNAPAYSDDKNERRYACAGIILSTTWILV